jgi:hypothetical protein
MATEQASAAMRQELRALSDYGATLAELLDHLGKQNRQLGTSGFSDDQQEELQLYCWALHRGQSSGALWGRAAVSGAPEDDIGA